MSFVHKFSFRQMHIQVMEFVRVATDAIRFHQRIINGCELLTLLVGYYIGLSD